MFWRMAGLSTSSPVETILDKENFTLEELLDEDEIIQECKAHNSRLINFLRERPQVEQLLRYIVEEAPDDAEKSRTFKFPFIACEIFTCEVDIILKTLVEDEELMNLLFSFLDSDHSHSTLLAGYFSKVVICLLLRQAVPLMNYIQAHPEIIRRLVDLIGITSIMEVLIRLIGVDEHIYANYADIMRWIEDIDVLEMILDKFSSSDCPEVHANAAETLCSIARVAPPSLATKISSPKFIGRLFHHALEESRPKSVLVNSLSICISLLDPKRSASSSPYHLYNRQVALGGTASTNPEMVEGMLESLGNLLKLLEVSSLENVLPTTYGKLQPPLGKHRLKIVEFIAVLLAVRSESAEKELIQLGALQRILDLFFDYPYNNFLHHHVESIILCCLESKNVSLLGHILHDCSLLGKILEAEKNSTLVSKEDKPTIPVEGRAAPKIGNIGHLTRISNKLIQLGSSNSEIQKILQENSEWTDWHTNVLSKRNVVENVYQWSCGRPTALHDRNRDSDDDDYQDRDYDVAALANNLSQAFRYGIYSHEEIDEAHGSMERDDEDVYFDDESAEVVISSLRLGDDQESGSLFTNSNWFAFDDDKVINESLAGTLPSPSTDSKGIGDTTTTSAGDEVVLGEDTDLIDTATSIPVPEDKLEDPILPNQLVSSKETSEGEKSPVCVEWRGTSDFEDHHNTDKQLSGHNSDHEPENHGSDNNPDKVEPSPSSDLPVDEVTDTIHETPIKTSTPNESNSEPADETPGSNPTGEKTTKEATTVPESGKDKETVESEN